MWHAMHNNVCFLIKNCHQIKSHQMDPAPPLSVRWFYATDSPKVDHSPFKLGAVDPPILVPPIGASKSKSPTAWTAFSRRDSARIEEAHQALLLDKTAAATVLVNEDYLYEVDVTKREICPVYWYGPIFDIRRGTWFSSTDNSMAKIVPCDDNLSKQLEDGYKKFKPWLREFAEPNAIPSQSSPGSASTVTAASPLSQPAVLTHLSSSDTKPADPSLSSNESLKTASPATTPVFKPEQKWALFGPYMNSHVLYTDKQSAHIISDNVGAKVARAFMSTVTRTPDNPVAWGTKVWRGWDEVEKAMRKAPAQKLDKKRASVGNLEAMYTSTAGGESADSINVAAAAAVGGGSEGNLSSKKSTEKLNQPPLPVDGTAEEESGQDRQINHLVLVIHGVGQKLGERVETVDFAKDCTTLRQALKSSSKQYFTAGAPTVSNSTRDPATTQSPPPASSWKKPVIADMPDMGGIQVLPVQWRQKIDFGKRKDPNSKSGSGANGKLTQEEEEELKAEIEAMREKEVHLDDITLDGVQSIRYLVSDIVLDVLLYMTPKYRQQMVNHVIEEMNRIYTAYLERNPTFNGKISVYGHSLGSLLAFDILCHQAHGDSEVSILKPNGFADSRHTMSELDLSDVMNRATMADKTERRLNGLMERAEIQYNTLQFKVDKFFAVGSPVGLFLLLKGNKLAGRVGNEPIQRGISAPACNAIYNVFHPHDPVAYRFEPLACKPLAKEKPVPIQYNKGGLRGTVTAISDLSSGLVSRGFNMFSGLFVGGASGSAAAAATAAATVGSVPGTPTGGLSTPGSPQKTDGSMSDRKSSNEKLREKESSDSKEKRKGAFFLFSRYASRQLSHKRQGVDLDMENVKRLNPRGRLDYVMQEGVLENPYLSSLSSHMAYWPDTDVAVFMLRELYNN
ncbi:DDHD domain-containing protein [Chytriomyces cf. hyalinus JEL632]|nr:DDHD domain-containing protein [Chytriomyces cf. hyalinus JEL632]